jgi:hypothetical protein
MLRLGALFDKTQRANRISEMLKLFDLEWCQQQIIEEITTRGSVGRDQRLHTPPNYKLDCVMHSQAGS